MAHISDIGASYYTRLDYVKGTISDADRDNTDKKAAFLDKFQGGGTAAAVAGTGTVTIQFTADTAMATGSLVLTLGTYVAPSTSTIYEFETTTGNHSFSFRGVDVDEDSGASTWTISNDDLETATTADLAASTAGTLTSVAAYTKDTNVVEVGSIREFPSLGTPSNIVNVPQFGQAISSQVQGQADAPSLEFTFNYKPTEQADLDQHRKDRTKLVFRVRLAGSESGGAQVIQYPAEVEFADLYFQGTVASFEIVPSLTDATQANIALTIDGDFEGPYSATEADYGDYDLPG